MPDPISYLKASIAALIASAMIVLAFRLILRTSVHSIAAVICVLAVGVGVATGYDVLQFSWTWPPASALNRFLMIVLPAAVIVELLAAVIGRDETVNSAARRHGYLSAPGLRLALYASAGRILLHDSVYLGEVGSGNPDAWTSAQSVATLGGGFAGLTAVWSVLCRLSERSAAGSITVSLAIAIQCTGLTTMMAGYIKGGAAAFPLTAALVGTALASPLLLKGNGASDKKYLQGAISIGVVGLFSLLCIGHYFGQLTSLRAIVLFLTPLLCWTSELPGLRSRSAWQKSGVRLIAVTVVLAAVLFVAKQDFDRKMAPLLVGVNLPETGRDLSSGSESDSPKQGGTGLRKSLVFQGS
jgi:hypothetical protein